MLPQEHSKHHQPRLKLKLKLWLSGSCSQAADAALGSDRSLHRDPLDPSRLAGQEVPPCPVGLVCRSLRARLEFRLPYQRRGRVDLVGRPRPVGLADRVGLQPLEYT